MCKLLSITSLLLSCSFLYGQSFVELSGTVVDAATKQPLANAHLRLLRLDKTTSFSMQDIWPTNPDNPSAERNATDEIKSVTTTFEGTFTFRTETPGAFLLFAKQDGYVPYGNGIDPSRIINVRRTSVTGLLIEMHREGSISGQLLDLRTKQPIVGLSVSPMQWLVSDGNRALVPAGEPSRTDKNGRYVIVGLSPGEYFLTIESPVNSSEKIESTDKKDQKQNYVRTYYPGTEAREQAVPIPIYSGMSAENIDCLLEKQEIATIRGEVRLENSFDKSASIHVSLTEVEKQGKVSSYTSVAQQVVPAERGLFNFGNVSPGRYYLTATTKGTVQDRSWAFAWMDVGARDMILSPLYLRRGVSIPGVLSGSNQILNSVSSLPLGVSIELLDRSASADELRPVAVRFPSASFSFDNVLLSGYKIYVRNLRKDIAVCGVTYNHIKSRNQTFTLDGSASEHNLLVDLCPATASLDVSIRDRFDTKPSVDILLFSVDDNFESSIEDGRTAIVDEHGRATFHNLIAGKYRVLAIPRGSVWRDRKYLLNDKALKEVALVSDASISVELSLSEQFRLK